MNRLFQPGWRTLCAFVLLSISACGLGALTVKAGQSGSASLVATNLVELSSAITRQSGSICAYDLEGTILASDLNSRTLFFQDDSGTAALELNLKGFKLQSGQRVRLRGTNYVAYTDIGLSLGANPLVDADNLHSVIEKTGEIFLKAGRHPVHVAWFNRTGTYFLQVDYAGPNTARQPIPASELYHEFADTNGENLLPGLNYRCFEGEWEKLPDFDSLEPVKTGVASNFDTTVKTREENVGLEFKGFLAIPEDGAYKFYLRSDDGGRLFLDDVTPSIYVMGTAPVPAPQTVAVNQPLPDSQASFWAETEGMITFISRNKNQVELELVAGEKKMQVEVLSAAGEVPGYLLNSRVRLRGICPDVRSATGQRYAGLLVVADWHDVTVLDLARGQWSAFRNATLDELNQGIFGDSNGVVCLHGRLYTDPATQATRFEDGTGSAPIELLNKLSVKADSAVECLSRWNREGTNVMLREAVARESLNEPVGKTNATRVLTTALQVQQLTREEAEREYPVEIQGVVTSVSDNFDSFVIQDLTRAVFVLVTDESPTNLPKVGDYCKIEGVSRPADFSPIVILRKVTILWKGQMPPPATPTHDQLVSGSLDAQYVEVRGMVIAVHDAYITMLTADGVLDLDISPSPSEHWEEYLNSIIRVRGCLTANWDTQTHRVILDQPIHLRTAMVSVDTPPPTDLFAADKVRAKDLTQFDVRFDTFRRVKIGGQIVHGSANMYYLMDGTNGLRFQLAQPEKFDAGDTVEVVGLVELAGASPLLRQAVARKTGHLPLPKATPLALASLSNDYDATLVSMEGILVGFQERGGEFVLEMQVGVKNFVARLDSKLVPVTPWSIGSRLRLTGIFCALDGNSVRTDGSSLSARGVNSFELLLNSPLDVRVLARPAWWTFSRLLVVLSGLLIGLTVAFVWIALLRHEVERRTRQLALEISERERAEKMRAIEHERSRIARDLHDDLGSALTEISMMATAGPGLKLGSDIAAERLQEIADKSRSMISALDGVVWVVNSKNDMLSSLIEYLASYAEEFLAKAQVSCRVELPKEYQERMIAAEVRHDVMLAVREALNNAVRHGRPKEVLLRLIFAGNSLEIMVQDDGCGFEPSQVKGNGLGNLQQRMGKLNGSCQILRSPGGGATVVLKLPLP